MGKIRSETAFLILAVLIALAVLALLAPRRAHAQVLGPTITYLWTATGDDSTSGRATSDSLRYSRTAIAGTDTLGWWRAANPVPGMPAPSAAGATDSVKVQVQLYGTTYYAILKVCDEAGNCSGWSNVAVKTTAPPPDIIAPGAVRDLRARGPMVTP